MDTYELLSTVRDYSGLEDENEIGTPLLLRHLNLAVQNVTNLLYKVFDQYLIKTVTLLAQSGTSVSAPGDVLNIINVWRERTATLDDYALCTKVPVDRQGLIGRRNWPADDANNPLYVNEGRNIKIYPTLSTLDVRLQYRKRVVDLAFGRITSGSGSNIVLDQYASKDDDAYVDYYVGLYIRTNGTMVYQKSLKITAYVGSTLTATLSAAHGLTPASQECYYALHPLLPSEYHHLIIEATLLELCKNSKYAKLGTLDGNVPQRKIDLRSAIQDILVVNDVQEAQQMQITENAE